MADPVSGGIGKASQEMIKELSRQMQQAQEQSQVGKPGQFGDLVAQNGQGAQDPTKVQEATKAADVLRTAQAQNVPGVDAARLGVKPVEQAQSPTGAGLKKLLGQVVEGQNKLDDIIKMATSGKTYGNQELLAVQAAVYKFSQELELTSKVVEKATSGVKQTMQTQV
jgi:hypothetical protein